MGEKILIVDDDENLRLFYVLKTFHHKQFLCVSK
jgi:hypothetical protein